MANRRTESPKAGARFSATAMGMAVVLDYLVEERRVREERRGGSYPPPVKPKRSCAARPHVSLIPRDELQMGVVFASRPRMHAFPIGNQ